MKFNNGLVNYSTWQPLVISKGNKFIKDDKYSIVMRNKTPFETVLRTVYFKQNKGFRINYKGKWHNVIINRDNKTGHTSYSVFH